MSVDSCDLTDLSNTLVRNIIDFKPVEYRVGINVLYAQ